ncbi:ATP-dependent nuclease [Chryseobacterium sp. T20]|uniref:ATP-dependent nuclease n=1 Tax=Chryseobacterium sp. T20 TaxID=3395375 RepID=UPI0039BCC698
MANIRLRSLSIENYRSFGDVQEFQFPNSEYLKPVSIIGYNNAGKSNFLSSVLYGIGEKFISQKTFEIVDLHNLDAENNIHIKATIDASDFAPPNQYGYKQTIAGDYHIQTAKIDNEIKSSCDPSFFGKNKHYSIFYINFHNIKEEISTQKTSWGNLKSFLAKHIQKLVDLDQTMKEKKEAFQEDVKRTTETVLASSQLQDFIQSIQKNYQQNLRNNSCHVEFGLPHYEDIFLKMMFKVGLNGTTDNLIPIEHFGDGFISMFVMAVIQAIAETNTEDKCLFLFEEPESFLHENHQEYFYKMVLCTLSERGHQVIYTTHSDRMIDAFDTKGIIRLEMDENNQTIKAYNNVGEFSSPFTDATPEDFNEPINVTRFNEYIKTVEPNLNRMLFSKKVILVEGPNDILVYKEVIRRKVLEAITGRIDILDHNKFADTYLNFENISFVCHHGKATALYIVELCKHFKIDYYLINDWDFDLEDVQIQQIIDFPDLAALKLDILYSDSNSTKKGMLTTNKNLIESTNLSNLHFNVKKLETVIGYASDDKSGIKIWNLVQSPGFVITENLYPSSLNKFLEINTLSQENQFI